MIGAKHCDPAFDLQVSCILNGARALHDLAPHRTSGIQNHPDLDSNLTLIMIMRHKTHTETCSVLRGEPRLCA